MIDSCLSPINSVDAADSGLWLASANFDTWSYNLRPTHTHAHTCILKTIHAHEHTDRCMRAMHGETHAHSHSSPLSQKHTQTHTCTLKNNLSPPFPPSCCAYSAHWQQIKRGLILRRAILLDLRRAFSLFHSLQTVFGARSLAAQCG